MTFPKKISIYNCKLPYRLKIAALCVTSSLSSDFVRREKTEQFLISNEIRNKEIIEVIYSWRHLAPPVIEFWMIPYRSSELLIIIIKLVYSVNCYHSIDCSHFFFMLGFSFILLYSICLLLCYSCKFICIASPVDHKNMYSPNIISMWRYECESKPHNFLISHTKKIDKTI